MADWRLNSAHLGMLPRREDFRRARAALLEERGWLTRCAERLGGLAGDPDDSSALIPVRPEQVLPGTKFLLVDHQADARYALKVGLNTVGRLSSNDIVLPEIWVSRRHCVLLLHARGSCELHDTASLNGTSVNGQRLRGPTPLSSGDWIRICGRQFLFISERDYEAAGDDPDHPDTVVEPPL